MSRRGRGDVCGSGTIGGVSPSTPPGEDGPGDWPRGQRSATGRPRRTDPEPQGDRRDDSDPYGWSTVGTAPASGESSFWDAPAPAEPRRGSERRRRPHRRRAQAGQQTGLDPSQLSALPSWLGAERVSTAPARRLVSLSVACFAALLGFGLLVGAHTVPNSYGIVIFGVQVLFVLSWAVAVRPAGTRLVVGIGLGTAVLADLAAVWPEQPSLAPLGYVTAAAFAAGVIGQLALGERRIKVTESLGNTLLVVVGVIAYASLVVLSRHVLGTQSIVVCLLAAAVALVVARLTDTVLPRPRTSSQVSRGSIGVVLGAMAGTGGGAVAGSYLVGVSAGNAAVAGLVSAMAAIMADLAISYADAGRELAGEPSRLWVARHLQGPLAGFALAAPAAYVLSVMLLVPAL
jgi:hypothetical protein